MEKLFEIFSFDQEHPMIFTQFNFWGFFAIVLIIFSIIHPQKTLRNAFLFVASLFFYFKTSGFFVILLLFSTLSDYLIGFGIHNSEKKGVRTMWLVVSVTINLLLLSYFKYSYFFTESFNNVFGTDISYYNHFNSFANTVTGTTWSVDQLILPVGISFFTFQTISYAVDVYWGKIKPVKNILDFGFYVSFFPQLVAGPIVRAADFIPQIYQPYKVSRAEFGIALYWILKGLVKKIVLADYIAVNFVDRVFDNPELFTGFENIMGMVGYSLQVYADFSGYTDIAIGVSLLMGFRLPTNFNAPYKARSVGEFWKRWHMSLSSWLKDYLYIPLGGSRKASFMTYAMMAILPISICFAVGADYISAVIFGTVLIVLIFMFLDFKYPTFRKELFTSVNLMTTMLFGGLWHGTSWLFVIWGGLNGLGLVVFKLWRKIPGWQRTGQGFNGASVIRNASGIFLGVGIIAFFYFMNINENRFEASGSVANTFYKGFELFLLGAGVMMVFWSIMNFIGLIADSIAPKKLETPGNYWSPVKPVLNTFLFITFTRIWFRSPDLETANLAMTQIWDNFWNEIDLIPQILVNYANVFYVMYAGFAIHVLPDNMKEGIRDFFIDLPVLVKVVSTVIIVFLVYQAVSSDLQAFIYFQF